MKADNDTVKELTAAEHLKAMLDSEGWRLARERLANRILDLQNISNVDDSSPEAMMVDLKARKIAAEYLFAWLRADIEGFVEQQNNTKAALQDAETQSFIHRG